MAEKVQSLYKKLFAFSNTISKVDDDIVNVLKDSDSTRSDIIKKVNNVNIVSFNIIENTVFKRDLIDEYNKEIDFNVSYKSKNKKEQEDKDLYSSTKKSPAYKFVKYDFKRENNEKIYLNDKVKQMLEQTDSKDVVTENFRKALNYRSKKGGPENAIIFMGNISNKLAHRLESELDSIRGKIDFTGKELKFGEFNRYLDNCEGKMRDNIELYFNPSKVEKYIDDVENGVTQGDKTNYLEYEKSKTLFEKVFTKQKVDNRFIKQTITCMKLRKIKDIFFELKQKSIDALMIYQKKTIDEYNKKGIDPYENEILKYNLELVKDNSPLRDGRSSVRVVAYEKNNFDKYIKYNDFIPYSKKKFVENQALEFHTYDDKINDSINEIMNKQNRKNLSNIYDNTIKDACKMTIFHLSEDCVNKTIVSNGIKHVDYSNNPYIQISAFMSSPLESPNNSTKEGIEANNSILSDVRKKCIINENKYPDVDKFNKKYSIEKQLNETLLNKEDR